MRICLISDVHANAPALEAVLSVVSDCERILHAGDVVGYNPYPDAVVRQFQQADIESIAGNHDRAVLSGDTSRQSEAMNISTSWNLNEIENHTREYLGSLPQELRVEVGGQTIQVTHGSYRDPNEYVYPTDLTMDFFENIDDDVDLLVGGHTHYPLATRVADVRYVNPGSVGLPRDGDPRASFVILDTETDSLKWSRVDYDRERVQRDILSSELSDIAAEALSDS